jgi:hypothetical protein
MFLLGPRCDDLIPLCLMEAAFVSLTPSTMSAAARLPAFLSATSRPRSSSRLSSENTLFICAECFRKADAMRSLPRGERATMRTRRSWVLSTRLTRPFATRRSTAVLMEPGVKSTIGPIVLTGKGPLWSRISRTPKSGSEDHILYRHLAVLADVCFALRQRCRILAFTSAEIEW